MGVCMCAFVPLRPLALTSGPVSCYSYLSTTTTTTDDGGTRRDPVLEMKIANEFKHWQPYSLLSSARTSVVPVA